MFHGPDDFDDRPTDPGYQWGEEVLGGVIAAVLFAVIGGLVLASIVNHWR